MKINDFINKYYELIMQYYMDEGRSLNYNKEEVYGYALDCKSFTFVGTQQELDEEFGPNVSNDKYSVICEDNGIYAVETFGVTQYDFIGD